MATKRKQNQNWIFIAIAALIIYLLTRKQSRLTSSRYDVVNTVDANGNIVPQIILVNGTSTTGTSVKNTLTPAVLAVQYHSLIEDTTRSFVTDTSLGIIDLPWQLDLASYTKDYEAVKSKYLGYYGRNLTNDLIRWFQPEELSDFVAALYKNGQVLTP